MTIQEQVHPSMPGEEAPLTTAHLAAAQGGRGRQSGLCRYHRAGGACARLVGCDSAEGVLTPNGRDLL